MELFGYFKKNSWFFTEIYKLIFTEILTTKCKNYKKKYIY